MGTKPSWFKDGKVIVSAAPTCGINKDGIDRVVVDNPKHVSVDDLLWMDVVAINSGQSTPTVSMVDLADVVDSWRAVPTHFNREPLEAFSDAMEKRFSGWSAKSLGELIEMNWILRRDGHGSPPKETRIGTIPYIKVSDLRAGGVNINPTNMIELDRAKAMWRGTSSGLQAWDLLAPARASSNIGQFCMLMPGQEKIVLTREVLVLRVLEQAPFDPFFLLWALSLRVVRGQLKRLIFMQTNRDDIGDRYKEILIPIPPSRLQADLESEAFRHFFQGLDTVRGAFATYLAQRGEHDFPLTVKPDAGEEVRLGPEETI